MKLREEINRLENLDYHRRYKNLMRWMKKYDVKEVGETLKYRDVECVLTALDRGVLGVFVRIQPQRSNQKINKHFGETKTISFD